MTATLSRTAEAARHMGSTHSPELVLEPQREGERLPEWPRTLAFWHTHRAAPQQALAWLCTQGLALSASAPHDYSSNARGEANEPAQGRSGIASCGCIHKHDCSKTHPWSRKQHCIWSPCSPHLGQIQGLLPRLPQVRVPHNILVWDGHWLCTRKTRKGQDSF